MFLQVLVESDLNFMIASIILKILTEERLSVVYIFKGDKFCISCHCRNHFVHVLRGLEAKVYKVYLFNQQALIQA